MNEIKTYQWDCDDYDKWVLKATLENGENIDIVIIDNPLEDNHSIIFYKPLKFHNIKMVMLMIGLSLKRKEAFIKLKH
jgi:hypothetical protein